MNTDKNLQDEIVLEDMQVMWPKFCKEARINNTCFSTVQEFMQRGALVTHMQCGFIAWYENVDVDTGNVQIIERALWVDPAFRNEGVGNWLLSFMTHRAQELSDEKGASVTVHAGSTLGSNEAAESLYSQQQFETTLNFKRIFKPCVTP